MAFRDTSSSYGIVTRLIHWMMALAIFFLFGLGWWMVGLDYYSAYYTKAPDLHRSLGIVVTLVLIFRFVWRLINIHPDDSELSPLERLASKTVHWGFYPLLLALVVSGYFISTTDGRPVDVFGLFAVPSVVVSKEMTDTAGYIHRVLAYITVILAGLHSAAALKHHFVDHSSILKRMWSGSPKN
ncbi:MAG: cytochrome b [Hyphomicrobium sp.]